MSPKWCLSNDEFCSTMSKCINFAFRICRLFGSSHFHCDFSILTVVTSVWLLMFCKKKKVFKMGFISTVFHCKWNTLLLWAYWKWSIFWFFLKTEAPFLCIDRTVGCWEHYWGRTDSKEFNETLNRKKIVSWVLEFGPYVLPGFFNHFLCNIYFV